MKINSEFFTVVVVSVIFGALISIQLHWSFSIFYLVGLIWAIIDERLLYPEPVSTDG